MALEEHDAEFREGLSGMLDRLDFFLATARTPADWEHIAGLLERVARAARQEAARLKGISYAHLVLSKEASDGNPT